MRKLGVEINLLVASIFESDLLGLLQTSFGRLYCSITRPTFEKSFCKQSQLSFETCLIYNNRFLL